MEDSVKRITDGLMKAIKTEHSGHYFYLNAAKNTEDPQGREVFNSLAAEELEHKEFLLKQYESLMKSGTANLNVSLGRRRDLSGESPIFSAEIKRRLGDAHYEMSALSTGITVERNSMEFYKSEAQAVMNPEVKQFYLQLAEWEEGHLEALMRQEDALKEDYWYKSGFFPF